MGPPRPRRAKPARRSAGAVLGPDARYAVEHARLAAAARNGIPPTRSEQPAAPLPATSAPDAPKTTLRERLGPQGLATGGVSVAARLAGTSIPPARPPPRPGGGTEEVPGGRPRRRSVRRWESPAGAAAKLKRDGIFDPFRSPPSRP